MQLLSSFWTLVGLIVVTGLFLATFGRYYNRLVAEMESNKIEGITAFQVAGGTAVTVVGAYPLIAWVCAYAASPAWLTALWIVLALFYCFTASGIPMIKGALDRHSDLTQRLTRYD